MRASALAKTCADGALGILGSFGKSATPRLVACDEQHYLPGRRKLFDPAMSEPSEVLTAAEAAVVARVSLRDVNRVIDEGILPREFLGPNTRRTILAAGCPLISFYFASSTRLTAHERLLAIGRVGPRLRAAGWQALWAQEDWTVRDEFLSIDLGPFLAAARERLDHLASARAMVTSSSEVLGGTPVIKGTRVPVYDVAASVSAGLPRDRVLAAYPGITDEQVEFAGLYAEAYPVRGRPPRELPRGVVIRTDRRVPRKAG
jgi:uncharacterized protein (DUF433 family)